MKLQNYATYKEIMKQNNTWENVYDDIIGKKLQHDEISVENIDEIILFGCGSSYNLAQSAAFFTRSLREPQKSALAIPSSELLLNPDYYFKRDKKYLLVGFSRSGETTETVDVFRILTGRQNIRFLGISCRENSSICNIAKSYFVCRDAVEKSIVMTESFSSMLLAYILILLKAAKRKNIIEDFKKIISDINIPEMEDYTQRLIDEFDFSSYFVLGSGFNYGLSVEADLKMKEMSQVPSYSYHLYEFSHGPKSLLDINSLCLVLNPDNKLFKYEDIAMELRQLGAQIVTFGNKGTDGIQDRGIRSYSGKEATNESANAFQCIPFFQLAALFKTIKKGLNPDMPKSLSYTVKKPKL